MPNMNESLYQQETTGREATDELRGTETIILVDDEEPVLDIGARFLQRFGYQVYTALDGAAAFSLFERFKDEVDLMITDVMMPGMNGMELAERIRTVNPGLPVLYISGHGEAAVQHFRKVKRQGPMLHKPYTVIELLSAVRDLLNRELAAG